MNRPLAFDISLVTFRFVALAFVASSKTCFFGSDMALAN